MPTYEYRCEECKSEFVRRVPMHSRDEVYCYDCQQQSKRLIKPPALSFVGMGFTRGYVKGG